ncbi:MAG: prepilin-type N-terminal cleavage/methylation domain-containing protein [Elusimicrobia bacterium]|nr:prepilin-type N-terminal cleavage/methylation domain-containing protein [Elusimicrobiota bacterium]
MKLLNNKAFTIVELMVVIVIIGILAGGVLTLNYLRSRQIAAEKACFYTLRLIERTEQRYVYEKERHSNSMQELVDGNFLTARPKCPSGGVYAWVSEPQNSEAYQTQMVCSIHGPEAEEVVQEEIVKEKIVKEKKFKEKI